MNILWFSPTPSHPQNAGNRSRIFSLVKFFQNQGHQITFVYFAQEGNDPQAVAAMEAEWDDFHLIPFSGRGRKKSKGELWGIDDWYEEIITESICTLLRQKSFDVVFCEYIFQSKVLEFFPAKCVKVIDTHDRFGGRADLLKRNGIEPDFFYTTSEQEAIALNRADIVIAIQEEEAKYYRSITDAEVVVIGHVLEEVKWQWSPPELTTEKRPLRIGYFGSGNSFNRKSINQFLEAYSQNKELIAKSELIFAGSICQYLNVPQEVKATLMGKIDKITDFYGAVDIAINPMIDGTGLKIKTVEAMNFGVPIISTVSGSDGLPVNTDFHLVESQEALLNHLLKAYEYNKLLEIAESSLNVIQTYKYSLELKLKKLVDLIAICCDNRKQKKTVVLVTDAPFWEGKMGSHQRILAMCQVLKQEFLLKVFFFGSIWDGRLAEINNAGFSQSIVTYKNFNENFNPETIDLPKNSSFANFEGLRSKRHQSFYKTFSQYITVEKPEAVIIEYVYLAYLMDAVPAKCVSIIDTHDVMCLREYRFYQHDLRHTISMSLSLQEEKSILEKFDAILAIQDQEYSVLQKLIPQRPIILCPHYILGDISNQSTEIRIKKIGFIGANNEANRSGLEWFITQVWPVIKQLGLHLYIFGGVGKHFQEAYETDLSINFFANFLSQSEIYSLVDCMINPVFVGGGLKIKTIEALAYGKPLVSTEEGAVGIGNNQENGIIVASNRTEFIEAFIRLVNQPSFSKNLILQGTNLVKNKFSPESCYLPLINLLQHV